MQILKPSAIAIAKASNIIRERGSVVYPTDTVYGLAVNALDKSCLRQLFKIKKRPETKPIPVMIKDVAMAKKLAFIDKKMENILEKIWPGPVTAILEKRQIVPDILTANQNTIGLRIPDYQLIIDWLKLLDLPITGTSANFSGEEPISKPKEIIKVFKDHHPCPNLFLDAGDLSPNSPSTVIDLTTSQPKILRIGPVSKEELLRIFANAI